MSNARKTQALSLLEGILDETAAEAEAAQAALEAEIARKAEEARAEAEAAEARRMQEIAAQLAEEEARQRAAAERRTQVLEAIRIDELKAQGLWKEPEPEPEPEPTPAPVVTGPTTQQAKAEVQRSRRSAMLSAAAAILVVGGGAVGTWMYLNQEFVDATTPFQMSEPQVASFTDDTHTVAFQPIPDPIVRVIEAPVETTTPRGSSSSGRRSGGSSSSGSSGSSTTSSGGGGGIRLNIDGGL